MAQTETFQLSTAAAEAYEATFVPALFGEWAPHVCDLAGVAPGQRVLDVACGTGIVARVAAVRMGGAGTVVGLDLNAAMLAVARRVQPAIEWRQGDAARLPFPPASFDRVLCQMALMFFPDRVQALREMGRVTAPGGVVALVVPASLDAQPAYGPFVAMATREAGPEAASLLGAYFACGHLPELERLVESAGLRITAARTRAGRATFPSADAFVAAEVESTPLHARISAEVYRQIREGAREILQPFTAATGRVEIPLTGHLVAAAP